MKIKSLSLCFNLLMLTAFALSSCDDETSVEKVLVIDNVSVEVDKAHIASGVATPEEWGSAGTTFLVVINEKGVYKVSFEDSDWDTFNGEGYSLYLRLSADESGTLLPGTYTFQKTGTTLPFFVGSVSYMNIEFETLVAWVSSGTVTVSKTDSNYLIQYDLNLTAEDNNVVEKSPERIYGYFTGTLDPIRLPLLAEQTLPIN